jgi:carbon monoxide dehydrogenase subunit G
MGELSGRESADIDAPLDRVWKIVANVEAAPQWQGGLDEMRALEHDGEGRATRCETETDAKVRKIKTIVRFDYSGAPHKLAWTQEKGDLKSVQGSWELEDLGDGRTRATYAVDIDTGRMIGMIVRGPVEERMRDMLVKARPGELKEIAEKG